MRNFILFISILLFSEGNAQMQFKSFHFTTDEGLPSNTIYSITEDNSGNIVLGTDNGLTIYNGNEFKTLNIKDGLTTPYIVAVAKDTEGTIWLINYGGKLQKLINNKLINTPVFCEFYNQILNSESSLFLYTTQTKNKDKAYTSIELFKQKKLQINTDTLAKIKKIAAPALVQNNEVINFSNNALSYHQYKIPIPNEVKLIHKVIFRKKNVCILDEYNLLIVDFNGKILNTIALPQPLSEKRYFKYDFIEDNQENIWLNIQGKGLYILKDNRWFSTQKSLGINSNENINFLFSDSKGRLWIATNQKGLFCIPNSSIETIHFENEENNFNGFATASDNKSLFIATNFSLYSYAGQQVTFLEKSVLPIRIDNLNSTPIYYFPFSKVMSSEKKLKSLESVLGRQLFKNEGEDYFSLFGMSGIAIHKKKNAGFEDKYIQNKIPTKEKINKIVYYKGEYYFNNRKKINVRAFNDKFIYPKRELKFKIKGFIEDFTFIKDTMWIAANDVIYKIHNEKIVDSITHINETKLENVRKIKVIDKDVYLCSGNGLFKISKNGNRVLNKYNFLLNNEVHDVTLFQNKLFVGTIDGLGKINNEIVIKPSDSPVLKVKYNKLETNTINLPSDAGTVDLQLYIQNFYSTNNQLLQYKIDNTSWINSKANTINLPALSYGKHKIAIRVKDINSNWTLKNIEIYKAYPFYFKWWFVIIMTLLLMTLFYCVYRYQIRKIKNKKQQEIAINNKIVELRQNALSAIMNPHFLFNSLNSIQYFINSNQQQKSSDYLAKIARLARLFLMHASSPFITLEEEITRLKMYIELEQIRFNNFKFNLNIDEKINLAGTKIPNMIVQPFVENAILHGVSALAENDGIVTLSVFLKEDILTIEVIDNGLGKDNYRIRPENHISSGINIIKERIEILQQSYPDKIFSITEEPLFPNEIRKGHKVTITLTIVP